MRSPIPGPSGTSAYAIDRRSNLTKNKPSPIKSIKVPTIYIVGGIRSKRLAAHARQKLPDPRTSRSDRAYDIVEVGDPVVHPVRETGMTWLAIMRACELQEGDIIVLDVFNTATWEDAAGPRPPLPEPHMLAPSIPTTTEKQAVAGRYQSC